MRKVLSYEEVKDKLSLISVPRDKALCALLYGSAGRINEVLKVEKRDIVLEKKYLLITLTTEKNWQHPERIVPIPLKESWIVKPILDYLSFSAKRLFPFSDRLARNITHKWLNCHPHFLRHSRLTHLVSIYNADANRLKLIAGWRSVAMANVYVHLNWQDTKSVFE
jgi:site-specific recombinase XerD